MPPKMAEPACGSIPPVHDENLCEVCREIDYIQSLATWCKHHASVFSGKLASSAIPLGTLDRLEKRRDCPACRLILSCIHAFYGCHLPPRAGKVSLQRGAKFYNRLNVTGESSEGHPESSEMTSLEVRVCTHGLGNGTEGDEDNFVGAILPLPNNEKISGTTVTGEEEPFSTTRSATDFGSPARKTGGFVNFQLVRKWLQHCLEHHGDRCGQHLVIRVPETTIRLIDVEERKLIQSTLHTKYVALSYVWGANTMPC
jgi:hypothetical protein